MEKVVKLFNPIFLLGGLRRLPETNRQGYIGPCRRITQDPGGFATYSPLKPNPNLKPLTLI